MKALANLLNVEYKDVDYGEGNYTIFDSSIGNFREEALKRNSEIVTCPKCGVFGNRPNMMRWHFESCKTVLKSCKQCGNTIPRQGIKDHLYKTKTYCNRKCYMESKKGINPIEMTEEIKKKISKGVKFYYNETIEGKEVRRRISESKKGKTPIEMTKEIREKISKSLNIYHAKRKNNITQVK